MDGPPGPAVIVRGTGSIGDRHLRVLRERVAARPVAYPVRSERAGHWRASGFAACADLADLRQYLPCPVIVATDTGRHVEDTVEFLRAGCDVLVEKPVAVDAAEAARLDAVIRETGRSVFVAYGLRFHPGLTLFRQLLPRIGRVHAVRAECQSYLPDWRPTRDYRDGFQARPGEGGVVRDLSHEIDYCVWLFGMPKMLLAVGQNTGALGLVVEEGADVLWQTSAGVALTMRLDYITRTARRSLHAFGESGELRWDAVAGAVTLTMAGDEPEVMESHVDRDAMLAAQTEAFLRASAAGDAGVLCTFDEACVVVKVTDAVYRSAATGCRAAIE